ncbi:MAG TPA: RNA-binding cell elongation regulator Jag/EloR [Acidimicrobiales bacterium]|jgi:spoIIIJ-associated protein
MEWVETTAATVDQALDRALDALGVDEQEAEVEVLEEPKPGLFGRVRGTARVRARVLPATPPPKVDRRDRRRRKGGTNSNGGRQRRDEARSDDISPAAARGADAADGEPPASGKQKASGRRDRSSDPGSPGSGSSLGRGRKPASSRPATSGREISSEDKEQRVSITVEQQADFVAEFLTGLAEAFDVEATVEQEEVDEDFIEVRLVGDDLGMMVGRGGATLSAIHELSKTVVQRRSAGERAGRFRIDIGGYRARRREALTRFAEEQANVVLDEGTAVALEAMGAADRKVIHDVVNEIDGVSTHSEGEEPRRCVVITPTD